MDADAYVQLARIDRHQVVLERTFRQCMKELREEQELAADYADDTEEQNEPNLVCSDDQGHAIQPHTPVCGPATGEDDRQPVGVG
jgi:hypothetical protein